MKRLLFCALIASLLASCAKLDSLDRNTQITSFTVEYYQPQSIVIDNVVIEGDDIYIPILYGKYEFPMHFRASVGVPADINSILGIDFSQELTFEDLNSELKFYIVAASGTTREYVIRPREIPLSENNYILDRVSYLLRSPEGTVLSPVVHRVDNNTGIELLGVDLNYPITIVPKFQIVEDSRFDAVWEGDNENDAIIFQNGRTTLRFDDASTVYTLRILSQSGLPKEWKITLKNCTLLPAGTPALVSKNTMFEGKFSAMSVEPIEGQEPILIDETMVEADRNAVTIMISKPNIFPVNINFKYQAKGVVDMVDIERDTMLTFNGWDDVKYFWFIDSEQYDARKWSVGIKEYTPLPPQRGTEAYLTSLTYTCTSYTFQYKSGFLDLGTSYGSSIDMSGQVYIYPTNKRVVLLYNSFQDDAKATGTIAGSANSNWWQCTINITGCSFSDNTASSTLSTPFSFTIAATGKDQAAGLLASTKKTFTITSDDGTESEWTLVLAPKSSTPLPNSACELLDMKIARVSPNYTVFSAEPVSIDDATGEILVTVVKDDGCYPMRIYPIYTLSSGAQVISHNYGNNPLTFATPESSDQITVLAQNGMGQRTYTVRLDVPEQIDGSDILEFKVTSFKSGFYSNGNLLLDPETGGIVIPVMSYDEAFPLDIEYRFELSENATASIADRGTLRFDNCRQIKQIVVTSGKGQSRTWYLRLDYRPQLKNWELNSWSGNSPLPTNYWANSNNGISSDNILPVAGRSGVSGDLCPEMKTISAPLVGLAAGSFFNGWFDKSNALSKGTSDPVALTFFGIPWQSTARIKGVMLDVYYHPGKADADWASITFSLINWNGNGSYVYHGTKPGSTPPNRVNHPDNTATLAAEGKVLLGTNTTTSYGQTVTKIADGKWIQDFFIPVDGNVTFTHIAVVCSSSCYGDYFKGEVGSILKVDNIRIIYE